MLPLRDKLVDEPFADVSDICEASALLAIPLRPRLALRASRRGLQLAASRIDVAAARRPDGR